MEALSGSRAKARLIAKELQVAVSTERRTLYFHGESMRPFLVEGDEVVVEPVRWERIRLGDVITYRDGDRFPTRRVVGKSGVGLALWCENWPNRFFSASRNEVLGRAVARRRENGWLTRTDLAWQWARWTALARHRWIVRLVPLYWRTRGRLGDLLRAAGLRRPRPS